MSFVTDLRAEMTEKSPENDCCRLASLSAMLLTGGRVVFRGRGRYTATFSSEHASVARYADRLLRLSTDLKSELLAVRTAQLGDRVHYQIAFQDADAVALFKKLSLWDEKAPFNVSGKPSAASIRKSCCKRAYLKGAFLATGWIKPPEEGYRAEMAVSDERQAQTLVSMLSRFGVPARSTTRKSQCVVYFQEAEAVSTFLKVIGASRSVFRIEDARVLRDIRNAVNRQVNCDARNLESTVSTAQRQIEDIRYLLENGGLDRLPAPLREIAEARLNNTEASYAELGELLDPPIGKSGVNNRLRRLSLLAQKRRE